MLRVAYFIRLAAVTMGYEARARAPADQAALADAFLENLIGTLELDKDRVGIVKENEAADMELVRNYALTVFKRADDIDRAGAADASTAAGFVAAANLLDVLRTLGVPGEQLASMSKYAKSRALEISRDIREGRQPTPPARGGGGAESELDALLAPSTAWVPPCDA